MKIDFDTDNFQAEIDKMWSGDKGAIKAFHKALVESGVRTVLIEDSNHANRQSGLRDNVLTLRLNQLTTPHNYVATKFLCEALIGTQVSRLEFSSRIKFDDSYAASSIVEYLKGTNVNSLICAFLKDNCDEAIISLMNALKTSEIKGIDLNHIWLDKNVVNQVILEIPSTQLYEIKGVSGPSDCCLRLKDALVLNKKRMLMNPYHSLLLSAHPNKDDYLPNHGKPIGYDENHVKYAGGILMHVPKDVASHIVSYLPLMKNQVDGRDKVKTLRKLAEKNRPNGLEVEPSFLGKLRKYIGI